MASSPATPGISITLPTSPVLSSVIYCCASILMVYANRALTTLFDFHFPMFILVIQNVVAVLVICGARAAGVINCESFEVERARKWFPATGFFVVMLITSVYSIKVVHVPNMTVFKNMTNLVIVVGDKVFYGDNPSLGVVASILLMVFSAVLVGMNDISFSWDGYSWMVMNCLATAAYALYVRTAIKATRLSEFGMSYYNNLLSLPCFVAIMLFGGESGEAFQSPALQNMSFISLLVISGGVGFLLSIASYWCVRSTSPTTYSIVGSMNKVPMAVFAIILFRVPVTLHSFLSIIIGLVAGFVFTLSKNHEKKVKLLEQERQREMQGTDPSNA